MRTDLPRRRLSVSEPMNRAGVEARTYDQDPHRPPSRQTGCSLLQQTLTKQHLKSRRRTLNDIFTNPTDGLLTRTSLTHHRPPPSPEPLSTRKPVRRSGTASDDLSILISDLPSKLKQTEDQYRARIRRFQLLLAQSEQDRHRLRNDLQETEEEKGQLRRRVTELEVDLAFELGRHAREETVRRVLEEDGKERREELRGLKEELKELRGAAKSKDKTIIALRLKLEARKRFQEMQSELGRAGPNSLRDIESDQVGANRSEGDDGLRTYRQRSIKRADYQRFSIHAFYRTVDELAMQDLEQKAIIQTLQRRLEEIHGIDRQ